MARSTVVLVHGAWHGSWCWSKVIDLLDRAGIPVVAVELPLTSLADDAACVRAATDAVDGPVVLCAHSYGGVVITQAGTGANVEQLVFLCALAVEAGYSAMHPTDVKDLPPTELGAALVFSADGSSVGLDPDRGRVALYRDCDPADAEAAVARLRPMAVACLASPATVVAWHDRPSTYVVCTADLTVHPELQRVLARPFTTVVEWELGHSPFLSRPDLVAELLGDLAR